MAITAWFFRRPLQFTRPNRPVRVAWLAACAFFFSLTTVVAAEDTPVSADASDDTTTDQAPPDTTAATPPSTNENSTTENSTTENSTPEDSTLGSSLIEGSTGDALSSIELAIQAKEVDAAKAELNAYIEQIETATHRYSPDLVRPLVVLGDAHMAAGEYEEAGESYGRAVHIDRVANGLHSSSQASIVYKEADAHAALGDLAAANDRELYAYEVQLREHKADSMDMLPATFRLGDWHLKTHNVLMARALYQQAEKTLTKNDQKTGEATMRALKGVATTYRLERFPPVLQRATEDQIEGATTLPARPYEDNTPFADEAVNYVNNFPQGEKALSRIANMVREDPDASALDKANAFIDLADWYLLFERPERATPLYVEARRLLTEAKLPQADRFATAEVLYFPEPPPLRAPAPDDRDELKLGHVKVGFTVTAGGDVNNLVTLEVEPDSNMEYRVRRSMRVARYRPPLVEDQLADAPDQTFLYEYKYWPKKEKAASGEAPLKSAGSRAGKRTSSAGGDADGASSPERDAG